MGNHMVTLAGTLRESYDKSVGYVFNTSAGQVISSVMALGAIALFVMLMFALIQKARGRDGQMVGMMAADAKKIIVNALVIVILLGPDTWFPWFASGFDQMLDAIQGFMRSYFNW